MFSFLKNRGELDNSKWSKPKTFHYNGGGENRYIWAGENKIGRRRGAALRTKKISGFE